MKTCPGAIDGAAANDADDGLDAVEAKLLAGVYDQLLEDFRRELDAAELALRDCYETLRIEKARAQERRSHLRLVGGADDRNLGPE